MLEKRALVFLSLTLGINSFFFAAEQVKWLPAFHISENNDPFYLVFLILGILALGSTFYFTRHLSVGAIVEKLLVVFLPTEIFIVFGLSQSKNFHYIFNILMGVYVLVAGWLAVSLYIKKARAIHPHQPAGAWSTLPPSVNWFRRQGVWYVVGVLTITGLFFSFGLSHLTEFAAVDEPLWTEGRIVHYWHNVRDQDWKGTRTSDKPGITIVFAGGPGLWFVTPKEFRTIHYQGIVYNPTKDIERFYFAFRFPFLLVITLFLPLFYFFLERLFGRERAFLSFIFIGLAPPTLGMSKFVNPDSLLWFLAPLALLAYLVYRKRGLYRYLLASGVLMGLALLTKYVANFIFVYMIGLVFLDWIYNDKVRSVGLGTYLKRSLLDLGVLTFTALTIFYIFYPDVWIKPEKLITSTLYSQAFEKVAPLFLILLGVIVLDLRFNQTRLLNFLMSELLRIRRFLALFLTSFFLLAVGATLLNVFAGMHWYAFMDILTSPKTISEKSDLFGLFLTNFYPLIFGVTPLVLLGAIGGAFLPFQKDFFTRTSKQMIFYFLIFILLYFFAATANGVAMITRYQIMLFPLMGIIAGLGIFSWGEKFLTEEWKKYFFPFFVLLFMGAGVFTLWKNPFPLSYASSLLPRQYFIDVKDMGSGSFEAAAWLNTQSSPEKGLIWTDKDGVCKFFPGTCKSSFHFDDLRRNGLDYIVVSAGRKSRTGKMLSRYITNHATGLIRFDEYYDRTDPLYEIDINGRPGQYVKVFRFEDQEEK